MFLVISQTKLGRFSWNLIHDFLNKFAIKWRKPFPPHLSNVSTLSCKLEMLIVHVLPLSWYRKKLQNLSHRKCGLQIHQIWIQLITECGKYRKRRRKNTHRLSGRTETGSNSDWERSGTSWITSSLWQPSVSGVIDSSRSVMHVLYTFLQYFPHAVINWIQILRLWRPQLR